MLHSTLIGGLPVQTGDLLCTTDGDDQPGVGEFWRTLGALLPGPVDHIVIYLGPGTRCAEAGGRGVVTFDVPGGVWNSACMFAQRGPFADTLYGVAYPLAGRGFTALQERFIRERVARFVRRQVGKPYNVNFLNPDTRQAYYCSQLAYCAYRPHGVNLNTGRAAPNLPGSERIVFPIEIWAGLPHRRATTPPPG